MLRRFLKKQNIKQICGFLPMKIYSKLFGELSAADYMASSQLDGTNEIDNPILLFLAGMKEVVYCSANATGQSVFSIDILKKQSRWYAIKQSEYVRSLYCHVYKLVLLFIQICGEVIII